MNKKSINSGLFYPYGVPLLSGMIKTEPDDFRVYEELGFTPSGQGEHLFLRVEKKGLSTSELITLIAADIDINPKFIGYSGLKDKHALTQQWISLHLPGMKTMPDFSQHSHYEVMEVQWHHRKLRVGSHKSNRFEVFIRNIKGQSHDLPDRIKKIKHYGFANYFGRQRFGRQQDNVARALEAFNKQRPRRLSRSKRSLYLSALRSEVFNQILSRRIEHGLWKEPVDGDVFMLAGSHSIFQEPLDELLKQRYREKDLHCGLSLAGVGSSKVEGLAKTIESAVFNENDHLLSVLSVQGVKQDFRANRGVANNLEIVYDDDTKKMRISVTLEKGCFLTTLLDHFIQTSEG